MLQWRSQNSGCSYIYNPCFSALVWWDDWRTEKLPYLFLLKSKAPMPVLTPILKSFYLFPKSSLKTVNKFEMTCPKSKWLSYEYMLEKINLFSSYLRRGMFYIFLAMLSVGNIFRNISYEVLFTFIDHPREAKGN